MRQQHRERAQHQRDDPPGRNAQPLDPRDRITAGEHQGDEHRVAARLLRELDLRIRQRQQRRSPQRRGRAVQQPRRVERQQNREHRQHRRKASHGRVGV